jgi:phenylalanyl-tRNA synthetase alpha chain
VVADPYTEPSMEVYAWHSGLGKLVEIGNSGMFRWVMSSSAASAASASWSSWSLSF